MPDPIPAEQALAHRAAADCMGAYESATSYGDERDFMPIILDALAEQRERVRPLVEALTVIDNGYPTCVVCKMWAHLGEGIPHNPRCAAMPFVNDPAFASTRRSDG